MFKCKELDKGRFFLEADLSVSCDDADYYAFSAISAIFLLLYVVGIPLGSFMLLRYHRAGLYDTSHPDNKALTIQYAHIYTNYEPNYFYWECIEMLKKCMLTGGMVLVAPGSSVQILLGSLIALAYLLVVLRLGPYNDENHDRLQVLSTLQILLVLLMGFAIKTQSPDAGLYEERFMGILLIMLTMIVIVAGLCGIWLSNPAIARILKRICCCCSVKEEGKRNGDGGQMEEHGEKDKAQAAAFSRLTQSTASKNTVGTSPGIRAIRINRRRSKLNLTQVRNIVSVHHTHEAVKSVVASSAEALAGHQHRMKKRKSASSDRLALRLQKRSRRQKRAMSRLRKVATLTRDVRSRSAASASIRPVDKQPQIGEAISIAISAPNTAVQSKPAALEKKTAT
jgi:hypothetical protein